MSDDMLLNKCAESDDPIGTEGTSGLNNNHKTLSEEAIKARREYYRKYRHSNPDRVKQWSANYWEKKATKSMQAEENSVTSDVEGEKR